MAKMVLSSRGRSVGHRWQRPTVGNNEGVTLDMRTSKEGCCHRSVKDTLQGKEPRGPLFSWWSAAFAFVAMAATLPSLRRQCGALRCSPAHEGQPGDPSGQRRRLGDQILHERFSPFAPAPHPRMRRRRVVAAAMVRKGTRLSAGWSRASRAARPLNRRMGSGAVEESRSQHRLREVAAEVLGGEQLPPELIEVDVLDFWLPRRAEACRQWIRGRWGTRVTGT